MISEKKLSNLVREIQVQKLVLSISWVKVLEQMSRQTPVFSKARYIVQSFGIRRNER
uniref:Uncharacterized protein n=1 Tax=Nelumbo nucifera TaxID=4432 RepID=A0A822Z732_NELNU|nr:TPA_asm: hypothetical protein HUJ06_013532 [Nelumbo nucifera]